MTLSPILVVHVRPIWDLTPIDPKETKGTAEHIKTPHTESTIGSGTIV